LAISVYQFHIIGDRHSGEYLVLQLCELGFSLWCGRRQAPLFVQGVALLRGIERRLSVYLKFELLVGGSIEFIVAPFIAESLPPRTCVGKRISSFLKRLDDSGAVRPVRVLIKYDGVSDRISDLRGRLAGSGVVLDNGFQNLAIQGSDRF